MMNKSVKALAPHLRFPEFQDAGPWEEKQLGDVCDILNNLRQPITGSDRVKGRYPYYGASGIVDYVNDYIFNERLLLVGEDGAKWGAFEKTAFLADGQYWVNNHAHVLRPTSIRDTLLENYLTMIDIGPFITGAAPPKLTLGMLRKIPIPIPTSSHEQQKIADCLSSLDDLISARAQKLEALTAHKKGLMQQLFPAQGQTTPQRRFPEFQDVEPWEEKRLGDVATFSKGKGISKADISLNGSLPCIRYGQLYTHYQETIDEVVSYTNLPPKNLTLSQANDVIIPASGETQIDIATASCVMRKGIALGGDLNIIRSKMNGVFLSYYMNSAKKTAIAEMAQGISVVHLYPSQLTKLEIGIPSPPEQQKIADCLTSADDLIRAEAQKLDALKAHKKGLMQQLFPINDKGS